MHKKTPILLIITFILSLFLVSLAEAERRSSELAPASWTIMDIKAPRKITKWELQSISGSSKDDMFAVGFREEAGTGIKTGIILQYDDKKDVWEEVMPTRKKKNLYAVWGGCKSGVFAVGDGGTTFIGCSRGRELFPMHSETRTNFRGVWGSSAMDVFAVGNGGAILSYKGDPLVGWQKMDSGVTSDLNSVWGTSSGNVFAVGKEGIIRHYNGNKKMEWSKMESGTGFSLNGIWGSSLKGDNKIFAVGDKGTIRYYNGNKEMKWSDEESPTTENINSIWGTSPNNIYAVGDNGTVLHYNGEDWSDELTKPEPASNLNGIWVSPNPHVFIVGEFIWGGEYIGKYYISGYVYDLRDRSGIVATIKYSPTGNPPWSMGRQTAPDGEYLPFDGGSPICWLQFSATDYDTIEEKFTLLQHCNIRNDTYMVYTGQQSSHCIAGVISEACQENPSYYCPIKGVRVYLYKADGCEFPPTTDIYDDTDAKGHYNFANLQDGSYKVEPVETGYTFTPQYPTLSQPSKVYNCDFVPQP